MSDSLSAALHQPPVAKEEHTILPDLSQTISAFIQDRLPEQNHPLAKAASHHFKEPGKQIRARLALTAGDCMGIARSTSLPWAVAVEMLHNASLVHDDICDGDTIRRGRPSVWSQFGRDAALALGDWLIGLSFELAAEAGVKGQTPQLVSVLSRHMQQTISGQALELTVETYPDWERYRDISIGKTAPLFIAPVEGVAELAGRYDVITPITRFFTAAGGCYQIANDMLNVTGTDGAESPASDMLRRAPNAVIVMFRNTLSGAQAEAFDSWLASGTTKDAGYWQDQLRQSRALALTARKLRALAAEAEICASTLASDCQAVITPLNAQLRHLCLDLANSHG